MLPLKLISNKFRWQLPVRRATCWSVTPIQFKSHTVSCKFNLFLNAGFFRSMLFPPQYSFWLHSCSQLNQSPGPALYYCNIGRCSMCLKSTRLLSRLWVTVGFCWLLRWEAVCSHWFVEHLHLHHHRHQNQNQHQQYVMISDLPSGWLTLLAKTFADKPDLWLNICLVCSLISSSSGFSL